MTRIYKSLRKPRGSPETIQPYVRLQQLPEVQEQGSGETVLEKMGDEWEDKWLIVPVVEASVRLHVVLELCPVLSA